MSENFTSQNQQTISGTVEHIVFSSEQTGFTVLELDADGDLVTVVGELLGVEEGEELNLTGSFTTHPSFGKQFKVQYYERNLPATAHAIYKYLASGSIKGIGPALARRIVDQFGDRTLEIIEKEPNTLTKVKGISPAKAQAIAEEYQRIFGIRTVMMFLSKYRISPADSVSVWKKFGPLSVDVIRENPFALCLPEIGIRFEQADTIAEEMGFPANALCRVRAGILHVLTHNTYNGHTCLPYQKVVSIAQEFLGIGGDEIEITINQLIENDQLSYLRVDTREYLYLPHIYSAELYCAMRIALLLESKDQIGAHPQVDWDEKINHLETNNGIRYESLQRLAIKRAMSEGFLILTGGPGTGKTTTLNAIINLYRQQGLKVAIAAPTGRAAKRISELTGFEAKTIHRLLEVDYKSGDIAQFIHNEQHLLKHDVIIVDEFSMVDIQLFEALLRAMRLSCRLIIVGDSNQLPSVGCGNALWDMMSCQVLPSVELKEIFRQAAKSLIVTNAHKIISGELPDLSVRDNDFFFLPAARSQEALQTVVSLCATRLPKSYGFSPKWDIQVLCPSKLGELGTYHLNQQLQQALNPADPEKEEHRFGDLVFRVSDKVMQMKNNYDIEWKKENGEEGLGIFNGDIGEIIAINKRMGEMTVRFDDRIAVYPFELLNELELAYAVTIHKSQGSEFDAVVLPLMGHHSKLHFRNLLYTAVTRAKKLLIIVGSPATVEEMVGNNRRMLRYSNLKSLILQEIDRYKVAPSEGL